MGEPMEIRVEARWPHNCEWCYLGSCPRWVTGTALLREGTRSEAMYRLAEKYVALRDFTAKCAEDIEAWPGDVIEQHSRLTEDVALALAMVRTFPVSAAATEQEGG